MSGEERLADKQGFAGCCIDDRNNGNPGIERRENGDLREVRLAAQHETLEAAILRQGKGAGAVRLGLAEERERIGEIFDRKARLLGEALRRQVIGVTASR